MRWGRVLSVDGLTAQVTSPPLLWDDRILTIGEPVVEDVRLYAGVAARPGDHVALHWDWACAVLDEGHLSSLRTDTDRVLAAANTGSLLETGIPRGPMKRSLIVKYTRQFDLLGG